MRLHGSHAMSIYEIADDTTSATAPASVAVHVDACDSLGEALT